MYGEMHKPSINLSAYLLLPQSVCGTFESDDIKIKKQFIYWVNRLVNSKITNVSRVHAECELGM